MVLTAIREQPLIVKETPLLKDILNLALKSEDYSQADAFLVDSRKRKSDLPPSNPAILAAMDRVGVRELALQIAVANGSPEAIELLPELENSKNIVEQEIAKKASRHLKLYGTPDKPAHGPFVLFTREVSENEYTAAIKERYDSTDIKRQVEGAESVIRNLNFQQGKEESTNYLINLLRPFFAKHKGSTDTSVVSIEVEALRAVMQKGGSEEEQFLNEVRQDATPRVVKEANTILDSYYEVHPEKK